MELPGGGDEWLAPSPSPPGPAVPDRHDEHGVGTFIWPPVGTSTWPPVGTFSWPRTIGGGRVTAIAACRTCGTEPLENARFCHGCGSPINGADTHAECKQVRVLFVDVVH